MHHSNELRLGVSAVNHVRFNHEISNPDYIKSAKFNNLEFISLDPVTLSYQNLVSVGQIILNSYSTLQTLKIEVNLRLLIHIHDLRCQQELISLINKIIPTCINLKHFSIQFQGITDQLYHQYSEFLDNLFSEWLNMHKIHIFPKLRSITIKLSSHITQYLINSSKSSQLCQFLHKHPTLSCVHIKLGDFSRSRSPTSFVAASNSSQSNYTQTPTYSYIQNIFKSLYRREKSLVSFYLTTWNMESHINDLLKIIQNSVQLKKFDIHSPETTPTLNTNWLKRLLLQFIRCNSNNITHFRCSHFLLCDVELLQLLNQFVDKQINLERLDLSNCCLPNEKFSKQIAGELKSLFTTMMVNLSDIEYLELPTCDVLSLSPYLDLCYESLIESYHIWHSDKCKLQIPMRVNQEWIFNVCDNFSEPQINVYFDPMHQFIDKIIDYQCNIYPQRLNKLCLFLNEILSKKYDLCHDVIDIIISMCLNQSRLQLQFVMNIPLLGTNYIRKMSQYYNKSKSANDRFYIEIIDHCFASSPNLGSFYV